VEYFSEFMAVSMHLSMLPQPEDPLSIVKEAA
jgi:hypothetical protein